MTALTAAKDAHSAAKLLFSDNPDSENTKALANAATVLAGATAEQAARDEADRAALEARCNELRAIEADLAKAVEHESAELVAIEPRVHASVASILEKNRLRAQNFHELKRLSLSLNPATIVRPPPGDNSARHDIGRAIALAQIAESRNGRDSGLAEWLMPALIFPTAGRAANR